LLPCCQTTRESAQNTPMGQDQNPIPLLQCRFSLNFVGLVDLATVVGGSQAEEAEETAL
jgi:hypothetical protein